MKILSPKDYKISSRTIIEQVDENTYAIVIQRKSRIIMKDGRQVMQKIETLKTYFPNGIFLFKTSAPVCSKTLTYLTEQHVQVITIDSK